jgi:hypothetical protein
MLLIDFPEQRRCVCPAAGGWYPDKLSKTKRFPENILHFFAFIYYLLALYDKKKI